MSNIMWHVALKPGTTEMQDVILADVDPNDYETIGTLLSIYSHRSGFSTLPKRQVAARSSGLSLTCSLWSY